MDSPNAIRLSVDLLQDAFGDVVAKVGEMLLERGQLTIREIMASGKVVEDDDPTFSQIRNALLVLTQHGLVNFHPFRQSQDGKAHVQVYAIDIEEVLARIRFPQYLEYVGCKYGPLGQELLEVVFKFGRVARHVLLKEAKEASRSSEEEAKEALRLLVTERILRPVQASASAPCTSASAPSAPSASGGLEKSRLQPKGPEKREEATARGCPFGRRRGAQPRRRGSERHERCGLPATTG